LTPVWENLPLKNSMGRLSGATRIYLSAVLKIRQFINKSSFLERLGKNEARRRSGSENRIGHQLKRVTSRVKKIRFLPK
jgi:hypothetical protein